MWSECGSFGERVPVCRRRRFLSRTVLFEDSAADYTAPVNQQGADINDSPAMPTTPAERRAKKRSLAEAMEASELALLRVLLHLTDDT